MGRIPEETIQQVLASTDIVDLIGSYLPLKRAGSSFKANCPFHNEKTPSFNVTPHKQSYHCFGCGEGGNAIGFVMAYENLPFVEAVQKLAKRSGVLIQEEVYDPESEKRRRGRSKLVEINNEAARYMHRLLLKSPDAQHARDYLKSRGFGAEMAQRWMIGWMPANQADFFNWAKSKNFTGRQLTDAGIARLKDIERPNYGIYVQLKDRLMFPIHNDYGDIIAYSGRQLRENPNSGKYVNSPETALFKKSKVFFGLDKARRHMAKEKHALLCEGQIDVIACHENGIETAIATLGTACTHEHARMLKRYTQEVVLCYDADAAGLKAADKAFISLATEGLHARMIIMPKGDDPDSFIQREGADAFKAMIRDAREYFEVKLQHETSTRDLSTIRERTQLANDLAAIITHVGDKMTKEALINRVSAQLAIGTEELRTQVVEAEKAQARTQFFENRQLNREQQKDLKETVKPTSMNGSIAYLCYLALSSKEAQGWLSEQIEVLIDPLETLAGGSILKRILNKQPDTATNASVQAYVTTLTQNDQLALQGILNKDLPENPIQQAEEATSMLINTHFQNKEAAIRARLRDPALTNDQMKDLMQEASELQIILKNLKQRFIH
ncbi:MAG: DNA primase [Akkermansiaceae bacterium]